MGKSMSEHPRDVERFRRAAGEGRDSIVIEFAGFLARNKKWWLAPIVVVLLLVTVLVILGGSAAAPLIYTLF